MAFDLNAVKTGRDLRPPRIVLYAPEGLGKSTFAASAPAPIFIPTEDGLGSLDVARFPLVETVDQVREALGTLYENEHKYQTVVIDSLDWLEALIVKEIESKHDAKELAYGKANILVANVWSELLAGLTALRNDRGMAVILIAHCQIKRFDSPETEPYDRYGLKLIDRSSALVREWADAVLFANYKTVIRKSDVGFSKEISRGVTTGERLLHTNEKPAYQAKNRYSLPDTLPLSWDALQAAIIGDNKSAAKAA